MPCNAWVASPMSTTSWSASSAARRNVASTTKVAPCSRCAGPKTSPRKLWAIIMWSRTVTLNTRSPCVIGDQMAERGQLAGGEPGQNPGQLVEPGRARDQRVEDRVPQQVQGQREAVGVGTGGAAGRGDGTDLAAADGQPAGVEGAAECEADRAVAVPAEFDHRALRGQQVE